MLVKKNFYTRTQLKIILHQFLKKLASHLWQNLPFGSLKMDICNWNERNELQKKYQVWNQIQTWLFFIYALFLLLLIAAFCFFFFFTLGFSYCSCLRRSPMMPSFWHFLLNLLIALSTDSVSPTLTVDKLFTHFCF